MRSWRDWSWADGNFWDSGVQPQIAAYRDTLARGPKFLQSQGYVWKDLQALYLGV